MSDPRKETGTRSSTRATRLSLDLSSLLPMLVDAEDVYSFAQEAMSSQVIPFIPFQDPLPEVGRNDPR